MSSNVFMNNQLERIADYIDAGKAGATATATVNLDFSNVGDMTGSTAGTAGTHGLVPAPAAGDQDKTLHGDGTWRADTVALPQVFGSSSGSVITLTDAADYVASDLVINIEPVQSGSGDPSSDNIRPISGWTGCNVWRIGKNLLNPENLEYVTGHNEDYSEITFYKTGFNVDFCTMYLPAGTYTISQTRISGGLTRLIDDATGEQIGRITIPTYTFTLSEGKSIRLRRADNTPAEVKIKNLGIYSGTTDYTFVPYTGTTYSITFQSEAGTVYGGTLDVTNGVLTVTKANIASYAGETLPGAWISDRDVYDPDNPTTPTTGAQVVYDLDTPLTYQVISTDVYLTSGTCNVWADTGDIITLEYVKADYNDLMQAVPKMKMPDYSAVIASGTYNLYDGFNYTAVKDCIIYVMIGCDSSQSYPSVSVNNNSLGYIWSNTSGIEFPLFIPLKAGDALDVSATNQGNNWSEKYTIFGM